MRTSRTLRFASAHAVAALGLAALGLTAPAEASPVIEAASSECITPETHSDEADAARGGNGKDHRDISATEQREIEARTNAILAAKGKAPLGTSTALASATIPVYVHVMLSSTGAGDVTQA